LILQHVLAKLFINLRVQVLSLSVLLALVKSLSLAAAAAVEEMAPVVQAEAAVALEELCTILVHYYLLEH
jgi:hypothetical protein